MAGRLRMRLQIKSVCVNADYVWSVQSIPGQTTNTHTYRPPTEITAARLLSDGLVVVGGWLDGRVPKSNPVQIELMSSRICDWCRTFFLRVCVLCVCVCL